jgi:hypothetical protein
VTGAIGYSLLDRGQVESPQPRVATPPPATSAPSPQVERAAEVQERSIEEAVPAPSVPDHAQEATRDHVRPLRTAREPRTSKPGPTVIDSHGSRERVEPRAPAPVEQERAPEVDVPVVSAEKGALPLSEAALIYKARSAAADQPKAALRLLEEHAQRFPNGTLVPEREVLAIEVLRRLDRNAEAERRLRAFEARYPESIHLRRLAPVPD